MNIGNFSGMNMLGNLPGMSMSGMTGGLNLNLGINLNLDSTKLSQGLGEQYSGIGNAFSGLTSGIGNMGFGSVPGFGGSSNQTNSMFGGMMQGLQQQQQMMMMMMMMTMMMMMQQQNQMMSNMMSGMGSSGMSGVGSTGSTGSTGATDSGATPTGQGLNSAVQWAQKYIGSDSQSIKGKLPNFDAAGGVTNNCADFVTACLENAGVLTGLSKLEQVNVKALKSALEKKGWRKITDKSQVKPGFVYMNSSLGHTELVTGASNGKITLTGSNGSSRQKISEDKYSGNQGDAIFYAPPGM